MVEFSSHHVPSTATRAEHVIRTEFDQPITVDGLARRFGVNAQRLRRQFREERGTSIPAYKGAVRMFAAIQQVATTNIDAVARGVGYKSRKNFYRTFRALTGVTPTAFRKLPAEAMTALMDMVWSNLVMPRSSNQSSGSRTPKANHRSVPTRRN